MHRKPQFTLAGLFCFSVALAYVIGICRFLGLVLGSFFVMLVFCYVMASLLSLRWRIICLACALCFASLPWIGAADAAFYMPGSLYDLPTLELPEKIFASLVPIYTATTFPLELVGACGRDFYNFIYFYSSLGIIRPFCVFAFWFGIAVSFGLSILTHLLTNWRRRRLLPTSNQQPAAAQGASHPGAT